MVTLTKEEIVKKGLAIDTGLCTMCGTCVGVCPTSNIEVIYRENEPTLLFGDKCTDCGICYDICPGEEVPLRDMDRFVFGRERNPEKDVFGIFEDCYQAHAVDPEIREKGASGGAVSALLVYALEQKLISGATVVAFDEKHPWQAKPMIAKTKEEVINAAASKMVLVPLNSVLNNATAKNAPISLGCVGLPCHVHGLRKLQYRYPSHVLSKGVSFVIGIHCGANGPFRRTEYFLREWCGIQSLDEIKSLKYRSGKTPQLSEVVKKNGEVLRPSRLDWTRCWFWYFHERCSLCCDWAAELSDVSVGDFWGPAAKGSESHLGSSTVMVRSKVGRNLVNGAVKAGYLKIYPTPVGPLLLSTGPRRKKHGNATRLLNFRKYGWPTPDYQYPITVLEPIVRRGAPYAYTSMSIADREKLLAERGTDVLWYP